MSFGHLFLNVCGQQMTNSRQLRLNLVQEQPKKKTEQTMIADWNSLLLWS